MLEVSANVPVPFAPIVGLGDTGSIGFTNRLLSEHSPTDAFLETSRIMFASPRLLNLLPTCPSTRPVTETPDSRPTFTYLSNRTRHHSVFPFGNAAL